MKLSIAIITYNHERFIGQTLEGIFAQRTNFDFEVVIGEDCSTDGTRSVILDYCQKHPGRIVPLFRDHNLGPAKNFKETLAKCSGEYLAIVEGDDYWTAADKLQGQVEFLDRHPDYSICCHRVEILDETGGGRSGVWPALSKVGSHRMEDIIAENFIATCTVIYRRSSLGTLPDWLFDLALCDWPMHILAARSGKIELMDDVMAVYRMHAGGVWTSGRPMDQKLDMLKMMGALDRHTDFKYSTAIRRWRANCYLDMAFIERANGNRSATLRNVLTWVRLGGLRSVARWRELLVALAYAIGGIKPSRKMTEGRAGTS